MTADCRLPAGWSEHRDEASGAYYYYNEHTRVSTWEFSEIEAIEARKQS